MARSPKRSSSHRPRSGLALEVIPHRFGICRLAPDAELPAWAFKSDFWTLSRSADELSVVCEERVLPHGLQCERGWRGIKVLGPLDFSLIGVLASISRPLAEAGLGLFTVSTYDTDYIFVRAKSLERACAVLEGDGHRFDRPPAMPAPPPEAKTEPSVPAVPEPAAEIAEVPPEEPPAPAPASPKAPPEEPERRPFVLAEEKLRDDDLPTPTPWTPAESRSESPTRAGAAFSEPAPVEDTGSRVAPSKVTPSKAEPAKATSRDAKKAPELGARVSEPKTSVAGKSKVDEGAHTEGLYTGAIQQHDVETTDKKFSDLGLSDEILRTVSKVGFEHPTPIQAAVVPEALEGHDIIGLAETGSGKTAAFVLPLAERLTHGRGTRAVIVCPTREIALQTKAFLDLFGKEHELDTVCLIGGVKLGPQISGLRRVPDILVATPGRLLDHIERRNVKLDRIEFVVLDEADHMLDLGFLPQINRILKDMPDTRQTLLFSATMPPLIENLVRRYTHEPKRLDFRPKGAARGIEHRLYLVRDEDKNACLLALLREVPGSTLIFTRRRLHAEWLSRLIEKEGFGVERIHSDRTQAHRVRALRAFRDGKHRILVATDVAARGLDIPAIQHVINFGPPENPEDYVHRAGRTARGSAKGIVSTVATWLDKMTIRELEYELGDEIKRCEVEGVEPYKELKKRKVVRRRRLL